VDDSCDFAGALVTGIHWSCGWRFDSLAARNCADCVHHQSRVRTTGSLTFVGFRTKPDCLSRRSIQGGCKRFKGKGIQGLGWSINKVRDRPLSGGPVSSGALAATSEHRPQQATLLRNLGKRCFMWRSVSDRMRRVGRCHSPLLPGAFGYCRKQIDFRRVEPNERCGRWTV
jgi:hypothetical protein